MDVIFSASYPLEPGDGLTHRIQAKKELWAFLDEALKDLMNLEGQEVISEVIGTCIWYLHPHYTGPELVEEVNLIFKSLHISIPENYPALFSEAFCRIILKKVEHHLKRE